MAATQEAGLQVCIFNAMFHVFKESLNILLQGACGINSTDKSVDTQILPKPTTLIWMTEKQFVMSNQSCSCAEQAHNVIGSDVKT